MTNIREFSAKPTRYEGVLFRSRLEAKWAAFFSLCGWRWQYEPENLKGWLPDFLLEGPDANIYCEVRPALLAAEAAHKLERGIRAAGGNAYGLLLFEGIPAGDDGWQRVIGKIFGPLPVHGSPSYVCRWSKAILMARRHHHPLAWDISHGEDDNYPSLLAAGNEPSNNVCSYTGLQPRQLWVKAAERVMYR